MDLSRSRFSEWLAQPLLDTDLKEELLEIADSPKKIEDAFGCELQFGTGGLRGILGAGTNRMNIHVVRRAAQATADVLNAAGLPRRAAIGYDSRIGSERFARETACVLAANGIETYLYPRLEPVPALSFAVRTLSCGAGICITASHNPAQYNGFKVYGPDGCQLTPDRAAQIAEKLQSHSYFDGHKTESFASLLAAGRIRWIPDAVLDAFVDAVLALRMGSGSLSDLSVVYTPLHGSGLECVEKLLGRLGVGRLTLVEAQKDPDGHFPACPYPNPEIPEAMALGLACCGRVHPDLLIGTDPDCDRCGVAVPDQTGGYRLLTGNEIGVLLLDSSLSSSGCRTAPCRKTPSPSRPSSRPIWPTPWRGNTAWNCAARSRASSSSASRSVFSSGRATRNASCSALKKATAISLARMYAIRTA